MVSIGQLFKRRLHDGDQPREVVKITKVWPCQCCSDCGPYGPPRMMVKYTHQDGTGRGHALDFSTFVYNWMPLDE